jgi:hypothetical protein
VSTIRLDFIDNARIARARALLAASEAIDYGNELAVLAAVADLQGAVDILLGVLAQADQPQAEAISSSSEGGDARP